ncbi:hypothetical protein BH11MYX1_BH11MYX1_19400 [soil metagenome]
MQVGSLVLAAVCGMVGLVAGRATRPPTTPEAGPVPTDVLTRVQQPVHVPPVEVATPGGRDDGDEGEIDDDGEDIGVAIARAQVLATRQLHERDAIRGRVTNSRDGAPLVGCAVIARATNTGEQTVLTDENGTYELLGLDPANYTVTIYYADAAASTSGIATRSYEVTTLDLTLAYPPDPAPDEGDARPPIGELDDDTTIEIPIPGRTFEAVLGHGAFASAAR